MKINKKDLIKAFEENGFDFFEEENTIKLIIYEPIDMNRILESLEKIPEEKKEHKHNWQFVKRILKGTRKFELHKDGLNYEIQKPYLEFVCGCGAIKRVVEKEEEEIEL